MKVETTMVAALLMVYQLVYLGQVMHGKY